VESSPDILRMDCWSCAKRFRVRRELIGESVECPHCKKPNIVAEAAKNEEPPAMSESPGAEGTEGDSPFEASEEFSGTLHEEVRKYPTPPSIWEVYEKWVTREPRKRKQVGADWPIASWMIGFLCMAGGVLNVVAAMGSHGGRFRGDNAIGATANAAEELSRWAAGALLIVIGGMFLILGAIFQLRSSIVKLTEAIEATQKKDS